MSIKGGFIRFIIVDIPLVVMLFFASHLWDHKAQTIKNPFDARIQEANAYLKNGDFLNGAELLEKALIADPSQVSLHLRLGVLYDDYLSEKKKAADHYQQYLDLVSNTQLQGRIEGWLKTAKKDIPDNEEIASKNSPEHKTFSISNEEFQALQLKYDQIKIHADKLEKLLFVQEKQLEAMDDLKQQLVLSEKNYQQSAQELRLQKERAKELNAELEERKKREQELERRLQIFGTSYEEGVGRKEMEMEMDFLRTQNNQMKDEISEAKKHYDDILKQNNQLKIKIFSLERALEKSQEDYQSKNMEMSQQIVSQREQIKDIEEGKHALSVKIQELEADNSRYKEYLQEYRTSLQSKVSQNSKLRNMIKDLEQQNQQLLSRIALLSQKPENEKPVSLSKPANVNKKEIGSYRVKKGESLRTIAGYDFIYGDREKWGVLYEANRDKIPNPNHLVPGQVLDIPRD